MDKDFNLENDPAYGSRSLRKRVNQMVKPLHDDAQEAKQVEAKQLPVIPVTGDQAGHKYFNNKSPLKF